MGIGKEVKNMNKLVIGIFSHMNDAENAISKLESMGYNSREISIVMKERDKGERMAQERSTHAGSGVATGATAGGVIGVLAGLLVATGVIPGLGAFFVGGPLAAALGLTGAAAATVSGTATGAIAGGILGLLGGLGIAARDVANYEDRIRQGGILIAVPARTGNEMEVEEILEEYRADSIRSIMHSESEHRAMHT